MGEGQLCLDGVAAFHDTGGEHLLGVGAGKGEDPIIGSEALQILEPVEDDVQLTKGR